MMDGTRDVELPEVPEEVVARIERAVFREIDAERGIDRASAPPRRRRRLPAIVAGAAAAVVLAGAIASGLASVSSPWTSVADSVVSDESGAAESVEGSAGADSASPSGEAMTGPLLEDGREIVLTGSATVVVSDVRDAVDAVRALAGDVDGRVEGMQVSETEGSGGWVSVRVPATDLESVVARLEEVGEVRSTQLSSEDVTTHAVDLRARLDAAQASVDRLTALMAQAGSTADLLAAEQALSERQALLEGYRQELETLEGRVSMSTLTVSLEPAQSAASPDGAGFGDGLLVGWNGLVAAAGGALVVAGYLLPWVAVAAAAGLVIWGASSALRALRSKARSRSSTGAGKTP